MKSSYVTRSSLTLASLVVLALPGSAGASSLYDNLSFGSGSSSAVSMTSWGANSFSTDGNSYQLSDVVLALEGVATTGTLTVSLYSSSGGTPATALNTIGTISDSSLSTTAFTDQTVTPGSNITLQANTMYFIVLSGSAVGAVDADWQKDTGGQGTAIPNMASQVWGVSGNSGTNWTMRGVVGDFQPFVMRVDVASSPEPGTLFGAVTGLILVGIARLRRRS